MPRPDFLYDVIVAGGGPAAIGAALAAAINGARTLILEARSQFGGKSMGNMISIGQGAGVAAALCAQLDRAPRQLDYRLIQEKLDGMGVSL